jgi:branched-subunit amino acid transport protein
MITWIAIVLAGLGSYALRLAPFIRGERRAMSERTQQVLRHAGMGGIAALVVYSVTGSARSGDLLALIPTVTAITLAAVLTYRGRSMTVALIAGGAIQLAGALLLGI